MKNFIEQILKNSEVFPKSRRIWYKLCCRQSHQNINKNTGGNSYIGRYSKGQISADNIGGPINWLVSTTNLFVVLFTTIDN